ncbi:sensor histidine kinase [Anaerocolumna xylanovorans]|uniref:Two-component system, sensor histidine kinase YesM n=1 Tax=Anaerocolumna xylanovorans DSM 12503 TaxID=1121345 RepID=A0A1M7Y299_9FIRM|nr:histidine kinase [Anaerocolumna xylanovorans]SHO45996.1 two-component system, sensor histidine kinase YesM [Anaerocolumna xylanovorans DSM 12503]
MGIRIREAKNRIKSHQLYRKLFMTYTLIMTVIVISLILFFINSIRDQTKENNLRYSQLLLEDASGYIKDMEETSNLIQYNLYKSEDELTDVTNYLEYDMETYLEKKLDAFYNSRQGSYNGIEDFAGSALELSDYITEIAFVSYSNKEVTTFYKSNDIRTKKLDNNIDTLIKDRIQTEDGTITFIKEIHNTDNLENVGFMKITFSSKGFEKEYQYYKKSQLAVFTDDGRIIYQSDPGLNMVLLYDRKGSLVSQKQMESKLKAHVSYSKMDEMNILCYMKTSQAEKIPLIQWLSLLLLGFTLFLLGEIIIHVRLDYFTKRLEELLSTMEQVKSGNLNVSFDSIKDKKKDEIDIIGEHFNRMCKDLDSHIKKRYLAEIEQKNAEMNALQSQINPHFLYNTLESIRMKAILNDDKEVGKMLYNLAVIFRSQVKESNIITIAKELYYCKKYLEVFEFRFADKFRFDIDCREEYMERPVMKFIVQPLVENYFVHGIRLKEEDNYLLIRVWEEEEAMAVSVEDNGKGMTGEEIREKNLELNEDDNGTGSIGLLNVHRRLKRAYGDKYGVHIEENRDRGLKVIIRFPKEVDHVQGVSG